jgi:NAD(P)-dependent dehydrogenase (short-subunit alcohol dehydrogenase family)
MSRKLQGIRAVITGAAQGIGFACAERFVADGARVIIGDVDEVKGRAAADALGRKDEAEVKFVKCDVADIEQLKQLIDTSADKWGGIDVLINNAGITRPATILDITEDQYDSVLAVNLKAAVFATQFAAKHMVAAGTGGVIINMSSVNSVLTIPEILAYNLSKGAINQLTRNSAIALAPYDIRVCGIGPGTIMTELSRSTVASNEEKLKAILRRTPMGRAGEPEEIAAIASFLASKDASYITGETVFADGGRLGLNYTVPDRN